MHFIHWGHYNRFKKLSTTESTRCCVCKQYSECTIEKWWSWFYLQKIPIWITAKGYSFTWNACGHSMGIDDPSAIKRYKEEHEDTELFVIPPCNQLMPIHLERPMPLNIKNLLLLSPFIVIIVVGLIYICLAITTGVQNP